MRLKASKELRNDVSMTFKAH